MPNIIKAWRKTLARKSEKALVEEFNEFFIDLGEVFDYEEDEPSNNLLAIQQEYQESLKDSTASIFSDAEVVKYEMLFDAEGNPDDDFVPMDLDEKYRIADELKELESGGFGDVIDPSISILKHTTIRLCQRVPAQQCPKAKRAFFSEVSQYPVSHPSIDVDEARYDGTGLITHGSYDLQVCMLRVETDIPVDQIPSLPPLVTGGEWGYTELMQLCGLSTSSQKSPRVSECGSSAPRTPFIETKELSYFDIPTQSELQYTAFNEIVHKHDDICERTLQSRGIEDDSYSDEEDECVEPVKEFAPGYDDSVECFSFGHMHGSLLRRSLSGRRKPVLKPLDIERANATRPDSVPNEFTDETPFSLVRRLSSRLLKRTASSQSASPSPRTKRLLGIAYSPSSPSLRGRLGFLKRSKSRRADFLGDELEGKREDPVPSPSSMEFEKEGKKGVAQRLSVRRWDFLDGEFDDDEQHV